MWLVFVIFSVEKNITGRIFDMFETFQAVAPSCPADDLEKIIRSIFSEIHLQTLAQADRRHFYSMLDYLLLNRLRGKSEKHGQIFVDLQICVVYQSFLFQNCGVHPRSY